MVGTASVTIMWIGLYTFPLIQTSECASVNVIQLEQCPLEGECINWPLPRLCLAENARGTAGLAVCGSHAGLDGSCTHFFCNRTLNDEDIILSTHHIKAFITTCLCQKVN